ncbi:hypothetical protein [Scytonema sp. UIC 10036]|nr:hypothetical protein [Scytonema sp. UIC 10036]
MEPTDRTVNSRRKSGKTDKEQAKQLRREAENQLQLLTQTDNFA